MRRQRGLEADTGGWIGTHPGEKGSFPPSASPEREGTLHRIFGKGRPRVVSRENSC